MPRMPREQSHRDAHLQEGRIPYKCLEADIMAEIGLEELNGLEMEIMRREMQVITVRLRALEEQSTAWHHHKEAALFAVLLLVFVASLWLWIHQ
uniref:Fetal and adult testis expressed 1 n=1 Tax=Nannospalax galili TaxID=1026970 RepID=A0A8C6S0A6_NANGA